MKPEFKRSIESKMNATAGPEKNLMCDKTIITLLHVINTDLGFSKFCLHKKRGSF